MLALALLAVAAAHGSHEGILDPANHWKWHGFLPGGSVVEIRGVTGDIHALPSDTGRVEVNATIEDGSRVDVRISEASGSVTVCAVRKGSSACAGGTADAPGARVDYQVRVPYGVHLVARTVNGEIQAESLASDVQASTVNGSVTISTSGTAEASTVNGRIDASLLKPFWAKPPQFSAVNGGISVVIPANVSTGIQAETRNGKVRSNLVAFRGAATEQKLKGAVGRGSGSGHPLVIRTVNGGIDVKQKF